MKLIGTMGSPFVRRVAISLELYEIPFEIIPLSVFADYAEFSVHNPMVKAPTLLLDDGTLLMESSLILHYLEALAPVDKKLLPQTPKALAQAISLLGVVLAACEKAVQYVYEHRLRPAEKQHDDWINRVTHQLLAACNEWQIRLEANKNVNMSHTSIASAVVWRFIQTMIPDVVNSQDYRVIQSMTEQTEVHSAFQKYSV